MVLYTSKCYPTLHWTKWWPKVTTLSSELIEGHVNLVFTILLTNYKPLRRFTKVYYDKLDHSTWQCLKVTQRIRSALCIERHQQTVNMKLGLALYRGATHSSDPQSIEQLKILWATGAQHYSLLSSYPFPEHYFLSCNEKRAVL